MKPLIRYQKRARKIKACLILRGVSFAAIAKKYGVTISAVSQVVSGRAKSDRIYKEIQRICGR